MSQIIILCGNMSAGKTTLARFLSHNTYFKYRDFDTYVHRERWFGMTPSKIVQEFSKSLDPDKNYIVDNWFKWSLGWEQNINDDYTLDLLDDLVSHDITVMLMGVRSSTVKERHEKRPPNGIDNDWYYDNIEHLQDALYRGFSNFTNGK